MLTRAEHFSYGRPHQFCAHVGTSTLSNEWGCVILRLGTREFGRPQVLQLVHRRPLRLGDIGPAVSFTFDDFPRTAYTVGGAILKHFGALGTFYTALGLGHSSNGSGDQFRVDDLYSLVADGHELASHTFHHISSRTNSLAMFLEEVREGRAALQRIPGLAVSNNFAYPFGAVTAAAKGAVGREMLSCRGSFQGVNGPVADLNLLRANSIRGDVDQLDSVCRLLHDNERFKGWLIFYTHDVRKAPSPHGCTPRLLEATVNLALKRSMKILTVDEVLTGIRNRRRPVTN